MLVTALAIVAFKLGWILSADQHRTPEPLAGPQGTYSVVAMFQPADCSGIREGLASLNQLHASRTAKGRGITLVADDRSEESVQRVLSSAGVAFPVTRDDARSWARLALKTGHSRTPVFLVYDGGRLLRATDDVSVVLEEVSK